MQRYEIKQKHYSFSSRYLKAQIITFVQIKTNFKE